ncbi:MAG: PilX N-terminal domain-containing pilus assembly protein [Pseudomonadota bacterium]
MLTGLIFLVILTMIGVTASRMSGLEERMSGNMRDRALAMQAAEMALRDAERDVGNAVPASARGITGSYPVGTADCAGTAAATDNGVCNNGAAGYATPLWSSGGHQEYWDDGANNSVGYGSFTGATAIAGLPVQPRYVLERFVKDFGGKAYYYRITVRAQGINANTVVWLQGTYRAN